jgi:hypothetical protein
MLGGLFFSYFASPFFDSYVKEFRLFADVINDLGLVRFANRINSFPMYQERHPMFTYRFC